ELRAAERLLGLRVGHELRASGEAGEGGELLAAALRDRAAELGLVVGEVQKGARGGELLAHEQQRRLGASSSSADAARQGEGATRWASRSPRARLPTWSWFSVAKTKARAGARPVRVARTRPRSGECRPRYRKPCRSASATSSAHPR